MLFDTRYMFASIASDVVRDFYSFFCDPLGGRRDASVGAFVGRMETLKYSLLPVVRLLQSAISDSFLLPPWDLPSHRQICLFLQPYRVSCSFDR